jgi:Holliday junction resolvase
MSYRKGRRLEYEVRDLFASRGWLVVRAAASKPVDLVCIRQGQVVLVECKYNDRPSSQELERLSEVSRATGARVLLAVRPKYGRLKIIDPWTKEEYAP